MNITAKLENAKRNISLVDKTKTCSYTSKLYAVILFASKILHRPFIRSFTVHQHVYGSL